MTLIHSRISVVAHSRLRNWDRLSCTSKSEKETCDGIVVEQVGLPLRMQVDVLGLHI